MSGLREWFSKNNKKAGSTANDWKAMRTPERTGKPLRNENLIQLADLRKHNALLLLERKQVPSV